MSAAAIIIRRQNRIIRAYREAEALDQANARRPEDLGVASRLAFRGLVRRGVLIDSGAGRYYIDSIAAERFIRRRRARLWAGLGIVLMVFMVYLALLAR